MNDSCESVDVTVNGLKVQVITYSAGFERVIVVDRYDDITKEEVDWLNTYLETEGFLFRKVSHIEVVRPA